VYLTSLLDRLHPTRPCLPLPNGLTWRCGPSDDDDKVAAPSVPEDGGVGVPPTVPEDDEVGGVVDSNRPRASRFYMAVLWSLRTLLPLTCKPSVRPHRPPPPLAWIPLMWPRLPWRPLGYVTVSRPLRARPPLAWEGSMRPLGPLSPLAAGETSIRGISMWRC
jgi:hypothetical protein